MDLVSRHPAAIVSAIISSTVISFPQLERTQELNDDNLVWAAGSGEYDRVSNMLKGGADTEARRHPPVGTFNNNTAKVTKINDNNNLVTVELTLASRHWAEYSTSGNMFGRTALQAAADGGHLDVVKLLLDYKADVNSPPAESLGRTPLQAAAERGHEELVKLLLQAGADINAPAAHDGGRTALQAAVPTSNEELLQLLLDNNADVNAPAALGGGRTALQAAAEVGHERVVCLLLKHKADINAPAAEDCGRTALQAAAERGHEKLVRLLIESGADTNAPAAKDSGRTALQAAAEQGYGKVVSLLLECGADINGPAAENDGITVLLAAAEGGHEELVKILLDAGADTDELVVALMSAAKRGHENLVKVLLDAGVNVNAKMVDDDDGWTALRLAAEKGHDKVVQLLIGAGAEVNVTVADDNEWTALQAASGKGHVGVVKLLIDAKADVNASPAETFGRTALQAAAEGGHDQVVQLLLAAKADVDAPPAKSFGRTALQAAVAGRHDTVVQLLLNSGANTNRPVQDGRTPLWTAAVAGQENIVKMLLEAGADASAASELTALQATAEAGHQKVAQLLLGAQANVNAAENGLTALQVAITNGHDKTAEMLLKMSDVDLTTKDAVGQNVFHLVCRRGNIPLLSLLLKKGKSTGFNSRDYSGSTPLHTAVIHENLPAVKLLVQTKGVDMEIRDTSGKTPLQMALHKSLNEILYVLLQNGASTDRLGLDELPSLRKACGNNGSEDLFLLRHDVKKGRSIAGIMREETTIAHWKDLNLGSPSILFQHPKSRLTDTLDKKCFADPCIFLEPYSYPVPDRSQTGFQWAWSTFDRQRHVPAQFLNEIPNNQDILSYRPVEVILVGYVWFYCPTERLDQSVAHSGEHGNATIPSFNSGTERVEISWIMRQGRQTTEETRHSLRSIHYRGSLNMKFLSIPRHGADFVFLFLDDIHKRWMKLIDKARAHLGKIRDEQLAKEGQDPGIIKCLLGDSKQWYKLHKDWQQHLSTMRELLNEFKENDVLYTELIELTHGSLEATTGDIEKLNPIKKLTLKVNHIEKQCGPALLDLDKETKDMIDLEFSLVSIYEARRSIDVSASMKRLSWITFIFLPLMFVSGLFGMNVNLMKTDPAWQWYFVIAVPFLTLVLGVWILCKYLPITEYLEEYIGKPLESSLGRAIPRPQKTHRDRQSSQKTPAPTNHESISIGADTVTKAPLATEPFSRALTNLLNRRRNSRRDDVEEAPQINEL